MPGQRAAWAVVAARGWRNGWRADKPAVVLAAWFEAERGRFALWLPVAMAAGVAGYFAWPAEPALGPALAVLAAAAGGAALPLPVAARMAALALAFAAAGLVSARLAALRAPPLMAVPRTAVVIEGVIAAVEALPEGERLTFAHPALNGAAPAARGVRVRRRRGDEAPVAPGDIVRVRALLRPPPAAAYPGGWDMRRDAFFDGMGAYGFALGRVAVLRAGPARRLAGLRAAIGAQARAALPGTRGAIAAVLMTGEGAAIPPADRQAFADSGLAHLLAVAGLHVGIVMGLAWLVVRRGLALSERAALRWPLRGMAAVASLAAGAAYAVLTGAHVPILRSFAMATVVVLGILTGRRAITLRAWAIAALVLMAVSPAAVMGVSFQMSFAAVLALIAGFEALRGVLPRGEGVWGRILREIAVLAACSVLAGTASLPFAAYHFGRATLFYVPANLVAVPVTAFWVMPWCLASLPLMPLGLARLALVPAGWGIGVLVWLARFVAGWPDAAVPVARMPPVSLALFALGLAWLGLWRSRWRLAGVGVMAAAGLAWAMAPLPDVFVGGDGRVIAARMIAAGAGGAVRAVVARGASPFEVEAPLRLWGVAPLRAEIAGGWCDWVVPGGRVRVAAAAGAVPCDGADLLVGDGALPGACPGVAVVDRAALRRDGAAVAWLRGGRARIEQVDGVVGDRPWVGWPAWRRLPMATAE